MEPKRITPHDRDALYCTVNDQTWQFELVPLLELPEVDLAVSVKARLRKFPPLRRLIVVITIFQVPFFYGYIAYLGIAIAVFFVAAPLGRVLAVVAAVLGLPTIIFGISTLRFDLVVVLLKTYEVWFFTVTSTVVSLLAGLVLRDARSLLLLVAWCSYFINVFVDANLFAFRQAWIATAISSTGYIVLGVTISTGFVDGLHMFDVFSANGHSLPAVLLARDGIVSLVILIVRNLYRRYRYALRPMRNVANSSVVMIQCVTFRCRLKLQLLPSSPSNGQVSDKIQMPATRLQHPASKTRLHFLPFLQVIDARHTLLPADWLWRVDPHSSHWQARWGRRIFHLLGGLCFFIPNAVTIGSLLAPDAAERFPLFETTVGTTAVSIALVAICLSTAQRQLLRAVMTTFDFLFIAFQGTYIHLAVADLCGWKPEIVVSLVSSWIWSAWMMCWDAVPPPARLRLGVTSGFAAYVGTGLIMLINVCACVLFLVLPPSAVNDRVFFHFRFFNQTVEFRGLAAYMSCASTIDTWAIRILWRLWFAAETELVVLDGPVAFESRPRRINRPRTLNFRSLTGRAPKIADLTPIAPSNLSERVE